MIKLPFNLLLGKSNEFDKNEATPRPLTFNQMFQGWGKNNKSLQELKIDTASLFAVYRMNSDIRNCVRELVRNTGKEGYRIVDALDEEKPVSDKIKTDIVNLFFSVQSTHNTLEALINRTVRDMEVCGNAYWVILKNDQGKPLGFQPADPRTIAIVSDDTGMVYRFIQRVSGKDPIEYDPADIIHFKGEDDPNHEVFGLGKLEPIIWEARTDGSAMMANYSFFQNNAMPSVLYVLDEKVSPDSIKLRMEEIKKHFQGVANYGKPMATVGVKDIKTLNLNHKDLDFLAGRKFSTEKICAAFGVPMFLLGMTAGVNNNNGIELKKNFIEDTILPIETYIEQVLTEALYNMGFMIEFRFNEHKFENQKDLEERATNLYTKGMLTLRQAKKMMNQDLEPEEEGKENIDEYIIHSGASAVLLQDVGIDPELDLNEEE